MRTIILFLAVAIPYIGQFTTTAQAPFTLVDSRTAGSNIITLRCRNSDDVFDSLAMYFLNGTMLDSIDGFEDTDEDTSTVVFQINRRLEGEYSCGTQLQRSQSLSFVAFPDSTPIQSSDPVHFLVGETARLECGVQPGALGDQYFARWFNGTSGRILYDYPPPSQRIADPSLEMSESPRYTIDPSDLSLIISSVQRNDSFESYRCEVGVEDPRSPGGMTYFYELTRSHNIGLEVIAPPQIVQDFQLNTVVAEGEDTRFRCVAQGYPAPRISWQHAGGEIVNSENPHFKINSTKRSEGFIITVTSFLTLRSADDSLNGEVSCIASPPPPEMVRGMTLDSDYKSTQLSVLGSFNDLEIEITTKGDVIIIVDLPRALPVPVHLVLVYRDAENPSTPPDRKTTRAAYLNTFVIRHIDFASLVPFEHFTAEVGLFSENVYGPLNRAQGEYEKDRPTLFDSNISKGIVFIIGIVPVVIILIIAVTVTIIIGLVYHEKHKRQKIQYETQVSNNSHKEEEKQIELNHKEKEHQLELNNQIEMQKLEWEHDERINEKKLDHEYKLHCLTTFKELLLKEPNHTMENLKELLIFLNVDIVPLLDLYKRKVGQLPLVTSIAPVSRKDVDGGVEADGGDTTDEIEETDFGSPSPRGAMMAPVVLDADEREVMELLDSFIRSAQASLQCTAAYW